MLRALDPVGPDGFEGLIARLLEKLTERRFFLAKSGFQGGRDMSTERGNANIISVECKRYLENTELNEREILGEIQQVSWAIPDLDLWVLVASRTVPDRLQLSISQSALEKGFETIIISTDETDGDTPSLLAALCANAPDILVQFIQKKASSTNIERLNIIFEDIKKQNGYQNVINKLTDNFSSSNIGYDNWRYDQNKWLLDRFCFESKSRAAFGQALNISDDNVGLVNRKEAEYKLDKWLASWQNKQSFYVLLGEEGDGKTWATASWLSNKLRLDDSFPAVVFLTSTNIYLTNDPKELLANAITTQLRRFDEKYWENRLVKWMRRPEFEKPQIIIILDGINERHDFDWRSLMENLDVDPWKSRVGVILTCRKVTWENKYTLLSHLEVQSWTIPFYNDDELSSALLVHDLQLEDIPSTLHPLIRKPRYFDLVIKHRKIMAESGDVTIERLLYEDWRDRISRKSEVELGHDEFHALIRDLAQITLSVSNSFSVREVERLLPTDHRQVVQELITSGILISDQNRQGKYKVEPRRLIHGLGLLLKEEVSESISIGQPIEERIAQMLEPHGEMDIKVKICGSAVLHAIMDDQFSDEGRLILFQTWVSGRNLDEEDQKSVPAYLPSCPETYVRLAEYVWSDKHENSIAQTLLMEGFLKWRENKKVQAILPSALLHWMGFIHPLGFSFQRGTKGEKASEIKLQIERRVGFKLQLGPIQFLGYQFTVIEDDGLIRLARVALAIISHIQRRPFIKAFVVWSLSRSIMGYPNEYELVSWVLKTAKEDIWHEFRSEINLLLSKKHILTQQAAAHLLTCQGSLKASKLRQELPENLFPPNPIREIYFKDPCIQILYSWRREDYLECLERGDLSPHRIAIGMKALSLEPGLPVPKNFIERFKSVTENFSPDSLWKTMSLTIEDHRLEEIEPVLAAFSPHLLADIVKSIIGDAPNREGVPLRHLSLNIKKNLLILGNEELDALCQAWRKILTQKENTDKSGKISEEYLFTATLFNLIAEKQLEALLSRPKDSLDLLQYVCLFKPLNSQYIEELVKTINNKTDKTKLQRILWFLSANPGSISSKAIHNIINFLKHDDTVIRSFVLELAYKSKDSDALQCIINSEWAWSSENWTKEDYWGSCILCEFGASLLYREIRSRVHPIYLGYAIEKRGMIAIEVNQYAEDIHTIWKNIYKKDLPLPESFPLSEVECPRKEEINLCENIGISSSAFSKSFTFISRDSFWGGVSHPPDADSFNDAFNQNIDDKLEQCTSIIRKSLKKQAEAGNVWFAKQFHHHALDKVISYRPDLVQMWLNAVYKDKQESSRLLFSSRSFYEALLRVLFENDPVEASKLLKHLELYTGKIKYVDNKTGISLSNYALFKSSRHHEIQKILDKHFDKCSTDLELFELALVVQQTGNISWLKNKIEKELESSWQFDHARSIVFTGFLETNDSEVALNKYIEMPRCWLQAVAEKSMNLWNKNAWAKHWFNRFLNDEEDTKAWACFRLLLKCVDRRFWIWKENFLDDYFPKKDGRHNRLEFLSLNQDEIKKAIKKNEEMWSKTFLGEKVLSNQVWPWMN